MFCWKHFVLLTFDVSPVIYRPVPVAWRKILVISFCNNVLLTNKLVISHLSWYASEQCDDGDENEPLRQIFCLQENWMDSGRLSFNLTHTLKNWKYKWSKINCFHFVTLNPQTVHLQDHNNVSYLQISKVLLAVLDTSFEKKAEYKTTWWCFIANCRLTYSTLWLWCSRKWSTYINANYIWHLHGIWCPLIISKGHLSKVS